MGQSRSRNRLVESEMLERAAALFAERGFAGTSLQEIANAMGISRPALYHYISGKEDLLAKLVQGVTRASADRLARIHAEETLAPSEKVGAAIEDMAVSIANSPARFRLLLMSEAGLPEPLAEEHKNARREVLEHLSAIIREGIEAGVLKPLDEQVAAFAILGMCNWIAWWYRPEGRMSAGDVASLLSTIALDGLKRSDGRLPTDGDDGVAHALDLLREDIGYLERLLR